MIAKFLKYYRFVFLVSLLVVKYRMLMLVLSDKALIQTLVKRFDGLRSRKDVKEGNLTKYIVTRRVNAVLNRLYPRARCLVRSVVLNEILIQFGHTEEKIKFGLKLKDEKMLAHAWVSAKSDFKMIYEL